MANYGLDPFSKLPSEICVNVLISINNTAMISQLIQASPVMLAQYCASKMYIIKKIIDYDEDMMQDAMAIVLFPRVSSPSQGLIYERPATAVRVHLRKWSKSQLPDPLKKYDNRLAGKLISLHSRIMIYLEDYITKATAYFPPREYLCLPDIKEPWAEAYSTFRGAKVTRRFDSANLTTLERRRLLKAFLMYYLTSEANFLAQVPTGIPPRKVSKAQEQTLTCVIEYFRSLYGAIFAHFTDTWLPTISSVTSSSEPGLLYPDDFYFDGEVYAKGIKFAYHDSPYGYHKFCLGFALLGPDRLTEFLRHDMSNANEIRALRDELKSLWNSDCRQPWNGRELTVGLFFNASDDYDYKDGCESLMYEMLSPTMEPHTLGGKIACQRAWVFFDDSRLYPQETTERPNFPPKDFLESRRNRTRWQRYGHEKQRKMRRLQRWHDGLIDEDWDARYLI
ncbi:hypothetical protein FPSE_10864 [Fusarium pseudograminearum CS3096]|uniref:Uncharacterized protein n=1 Tax=Fusarium pseudograminearum (strain CS3096) TaxID=1028729 RepID=K3V727_FUSPC|nr:hypothetical protein FPSE_10864 [Fusarium pseudograminearum CS3096]EKJ68939.1 hypothetical protein FPSE_10864 [Fusarium pseudograminearum CS3096]